jgi:predicted DNA-binding protein
MNEREITKTVSFRLGIDQYTRLEEIRLNEGARSVSVLFRRAIERLLQETSSNLIAKEELTSRVQKLEKRVDALTINVKELKKSSLT